MWKRTSLITGGALVALAITTGCSNSDPGGEHPASHPTSAAATAPATSVAPNGQQHNSADVMFAQHMIPHHQQAVEMSDLVLGKQGIDPRVTDLAEQIKAAQGPEIQQMQDWLKQWGNPPMPPMPSTDMNMPGHNMPGMSGMPGMQGMMSEADMTALTNAQGVEASKLFLTQMISHHEGAISMAQDEIDQGQYGPAIEMAQNIKTSQQREIDTMKGLLQTL